MSVEMSIGCKACGEQFEGADVREWLANRTPCPDCGEISYNVNVLAHETIAVATELASVEVSSPNGLSIADRMQHIKRSLASLGEVSAATPDWIAGTRHLLHDVYVNLWAMREASVAAGVAKAAVDQAIDGDADMQYAMDLGNAAKHGTPLRSVRSGKQPSFGDLKGVMSGAVWVADETVSFDGVAMSGVAIAGAATSAWEQHLLAWGVG